MVITTINQNNQKLILKMFLDGNIINELPLGQNNQKFILEYNFNKKLFKLEIKSLSISSFIDIIIII
jgi:hypothetical protein